MQAGISVADALAATFAEVSDDLRTRDLGVHNIAPTAFDRIVFELVAGARRD